MLILGFGFGSILDPTDNLTMLYRSDASCFCIIVASNSLLLFPNKHAVWIFVLQIQGVV